MAEPKRKTVSVRVCDLHEHFTLCVYLFEVYRGMSIFTAMSCRIMLHV